MCPSYHLMRHGPSAIWKHADIFRCPTHRSVSVSSTLLGLWPSLKGFTHLRQCHFRLWAIESRTRSPCCQHGTRKCSSTALRTPFMLVVRLHAETPKLAMLAQLFRSREPSRLPAPTAHGGCKQNVPHSPRCFKCLASEDLR